MAAQYLIGLLALACVRGPVSPPPAAAGGGASGVSPAEKPWPPTIHEARRHYLTALLLAESGALGESERSLQRAALFDPSSPWMELGYGRFLVDLGQQERAESHLLTAVERGAGHDGRAALIGLYVEMARWDDARTALDDWRGDELGLHERRVRAGLRLQLGDPEGAMSDLAAWLTENPRDQSALTDYLRAAGRAGRWYSALETLQALAVKAPGSVALQRSMAQVAAHVDHELLAAEAVAAWDTLTDGRDVEAVLERARSALRREATDEAGVLLARLAELEGEPGPDRSSLEAGLMALAGDPAGARTALEAALVEWPGDRVLALRLAEVEADAGAITAASAAVGRAEGLTEGTRARIEARFLVHGGEPEAAIDRLNEALETGEPEVALALAGALVDAGRPEEAVALLEGILGRENPPPGVSVKLTWALAQALDSAGRGRDALDRALYALDLDADFRPAMGYLGRNHTDAGLLADDARRLLTLAIEETPADAGLMDALALVHYQTGNLQEALGWLKQAAVLEPESEQIREHLAEVEAALEGA